MRHKRHASVVYLHLTTTFFTNFKLTHSKNPEFRQEVLRSRWRISLAATAGVPDTEASSREPIQNTVRHESFIRAIHLYSKKPRLTEPAGSSGRLLPYCDSVGPNSQSINPPKPPPPAQLSLLRFIHFQTFTVQTLIGYKHHEI